MSAWGRSLPTACSSRSEATPANEATSELDRETERAVLDEACAERGRLALIVVTHRMETVSTAGSIAVLDRGRLVDMGPHERLRDDAGVYVALCERQEDMMAVGG